MVGFYHGGNVPEGQDEDEGDEDDDEDGGGDDQVLLIPLFASEFSFFHLHCIRKPKYKIIDIGIQKMINRKYTKNTNL